jgi:hypothetical protein
MNAAKLGVIFFLGMLSMWNFMRTTYAYGGIPSFYALDVVIMTFNFWLAWMTCSPNSPADRGGE